MSAADPLFPVAILIDELRQDEPSLRRHAVANLAQIALVLREQRTRDELIPFLCSEMVDDDDSVLAPLAEALGNMVPLVGGPEWAHCLIAPLQELCCKEEAVVRTKVGSMWWEG